MRRTGQIRDSLQRSKFVKDVGSLWSAQLVGAVATIAQGILVARLLGPSRYGMTALVIAVPSLIFVFLDARASDASVRFLSEFHGRGETENARAFLALGMGLDVTAAIATLAVVVAVAAWAAHHVVHSQATTGLLVVYAASMVFRAPASTAEAALVTLTRYRQLSVAQASISVVKALVSVGFVLVSRTVGGLVLGTSVGLAIEGISMVVLVSAIAERSWGPWYRSRLQVLRSRSTEIIRFVVWADVASLLGIASKQSDVIFVGAIAGPSAAGFYRLASNLGQLSGFVIAPLQSVLYQRFAKLRAAGSERDLRDAVRRSIAHVALPIGGFGLMAVAITPWAVRFTAGARYLPATGIAEVMMLSAAVWALFLWVRPLAFALDELALWATSSAAVAVVSLAGYAAVVPAFGAIGASWVRFMATVGTQTLPAEAMRRRYARGSYAAKMLRAEA